MHRYIPTGIQLFQIQMPNVCLQNLCLHSYPFVYSIAFGIQMLVCMHVDFAHFERIVFVEAV